MSGQINARKKDEKEEGVVFMRMKRAGKRFEIAVYKDLIPTKRNDESVTSKLDLSKVMQVEKIFSNAAKGDIHKKDDLVKAFSDVSGRELKTEQDIIRYIIQTGDLQVDDASRKETAKASTGALKELAILVNAKVFKPETATEDKKKKKSGSQGAVTKWTDDDIERELKNVRFHASDKDMSKNVVNAIKAIATGGTIPIERKQSRCKFNADDDTMDALEEFCTTNEGFAFVAKESDDTMDIVFDPVEPWVLEGLTKICDSYETIKHHDKTDGDLTEKGTKIVAEAKKEKGGGKKKGKEEKKKGKGRAADDDDDEPEEEITSTTAKPKKGKGKGKSAPSGGGGGGGNNDDDGKDLKAMLASLGMDDGMYCILAVCKPLEGGGSKKQNKTDDGDDGKAAKGKGKKKKGKR